jgi:uncharacterized membrane-anchored protein YhcB (DUF1043 family)
MDARGPSRRGEEQVQPVSGESAGFQVDRQVVDRLRRLAADSREPMPQVGGLRQEMPGHQQQTEGYGAAPMQGHQRQAGGYGAAPMPAQMLQPGGYGQAMPGPQVVAHGVQPMPGQMPQVGGLRQEMPGHQQQAEGYGAAPMQAQAPMPGQMQEGRGFQGGKSASSGSFFPEVLASLKARVTGAGRSTETPEDTAPAPAPTAKASISELEAAHTGTPAPATPVSAEVKRSKSPVLVDAPASIESSTTDKYHYTDSVVFASVTSDADMTQVHATHLQKFQEELCKLNLNDVSQFAFNRTVAASVESKHLKMSDLTFAAVQMRKVGDSFQCAVAVSPYKHSIVVATREGEVKSSTPLLLDTSADLDFTVQQFAVNKEAGDQVLLFDEADLLLCGAETNEDCKKRFVGGEYIEQTTRSLALTVFNVLPVLTSQESSDKIEKILGGDAQPTRLKKDAAAEDMLCSVQTLAENVQIAEQAATTAEESAVANLSTLTGELEDATEFLQLGMPAEAVSQATSMGDFHTAHPEAAQVLQTLVQEIGEASKKPSGEEKNAAFDLLVQRAKGELSKLELKEPSKPRGQEEASGTIAQRYYNYLDALLKKIGPQQASDVLSAQRKIAENEPKIEALQRQLATTKEALKIAKAKFELAKKYQEYNTAMAQVSAELVDDEDFVAEAEAHSVADAKKSEEQSFLKSALKDYVAAVKGITPMFTAPKKFDVPMHTQDLVRTMIERPAAWTEANVGALRAYLLDGDPRLKCNKLQEFFNPENVDKKLMTSGQIRFSLLLEVLSADEVLFSKKTLDFPELAKQLVGRFDAALRATGHLPYTEEAFKEALDGFSTCPVLKTHTPSELTRSKVPKSATNYSNTVHRMLERCDRQIASKEHLRRLLMLAGSSARRDDLTALFAVLKREGKNEVPPKAPQTYQYVQDSVLDKWIDELSREKMVTETQIEGLNLVVKGMKDVLVSAKDVTLRSRKLYDRKETEVEGELETERLMVNVMSVVGEYGPEGFSGNPADRRCKFKSDYYDLAEFFRNHPVFQRYSRSQTPLASGNANDTVEMTAVIALCDRKKAMKAHIAKFARGEGLEGLAILPEDWDLYKTCFEELMEAASHPGATMSRVDILVADVLAENIKYFSAPGGRFDYRKGAEGANVRSLAAEILRRVAMDIVYPEESGLDSELLQVYATILNFKSSLLEKTISWDHLWAPALSLFDKKQEAAEIAKFKGNIEVLKGLVTRMASGGEVSREDIGKAVGATDLLPASYVPIVRIHERTNYGRTEEAIIGAGAGGAFAASFGQDGGARGSHMPGASGMPSAVSSMPAASERAMYSFENLSADLHFEEQNLREVEVARGVLRASKLEKFEKERAERRERGGTAEQDFWNELCDRENGQVRSLEDKTQEVSERIANIQRMIEPAKAFTAQISSLSIDDLREEYRAREEASTTDLLVRSQALEIQDLLGRRMTAEREEVSRQVALAKEAADGQVSIGGEEALVAEAAAHGDGQAAADDQVSTDGEAAAAGARVDDAAAQDGDDDRVSTAASEEEARSDGLAATSPSPRRGSASSSEAGGDAGRSLSLVGEGGGATATTPPPQPVVLAAGGERGQSQKPSQHGGAGGLHSMWQQSPQVGAAQHGKSPNSGRGGGGSPATQRGGRGRGK